MRYLVFSLTLTLFLLPEPAPLAGGGCGTGQVCCPKCNYVCEFSVDKAKEKKHCYEVQCKTICIPPLTFPWQSGHACGKDIACRGTTRCGRVKFVRVLVKQEYECTRCKHTWKAVRVKCGPTDDDRVPTTDREDPGIVPPLPIDGGRQRRRFESTPVRFEEPRQENGSPPVATQPDLSGLHKGL